MLESKVRSEGLWVSDSRPKTFPLFFSCGPMVSNVTVTALISHDGQAYFGLLGFCCVFFSPPLMGVIERKKRTDKYAFAVFFHGYGKITLFAVMFSEILTSL